MMRMDREDVLLPLLKDLSDLASERLAAGREHGYGSREFDAACERMRSRLYDEQDIIIAALRELKDATAND